MPVLEKIIDERKVLAQQILHEIKTLYALPGGGYQKDFVKQKVSEITQLYRDERSIFYKDLELSWLFSNPKSIFFQNMVLARMYCDSTNPLLYKNTALIEFLYTPQDDLENHIQELLFSYNDNKKSFKAQGRTFK